RHSPIRRRRHPRRARPAPRTHTRIRVLPDVHLRLHRTTQGRAHHPRQRSGPGRRPTMAAGDERAHPLPRPPHLRRLDPGTVGRAAQRRHRGHRPTTHAPRPRHPAKPDQQVRAGRPAPNRRATARASRGTRITTRPAPPTHRRRPGTRNSHHRDQNRMPRTNRAPPLRPNRRHPVRHHRHHHPRATHTTPTAPRHRTHRHRGVPTR